jgi:hypothetical protein
MPRLSYSNVAATLAVVIALGGTAHAAGLPKNSVGSAQIKKGAVKSADIKDGSVTGRDVKESALARVPDAERLGGLAPAAFQRAPTSTRGDFAGTNLVREVPGYGTFELQCALFTASATDDEVRFSWSIGEIGADPRSQFSLSRAPTSSAVDISVAYVTTSGGGSGTTGDDRTFVDGIFYDLRGTKAIRVVARGYDDPDVQGCSGLITAQVVG